MLKRMETFLNHLNVGFVLSRRFHLNKRCEDAEAPERDTPDQLGKAVGLVVSAVFFSSFFFF